ncbi:DUF2634 domain-containing protein [Paenibacillus alvei]|uniref:contractile injection system sheath initiator n=1 Tax=Paenibacillus alvei TaxID=44250 RepID=UPI003D26DEE8
MRTWALYDGDLQLSDGQIAWTDGREELAQAVRIRLGTRLGEYFFAPDMGLDQERMVGKQADEDTIREAIMRSLMDEPRIQSVEDVEVTLDKHSRTAQVRLVMTSSEGEEVELIYADGSGIEA